MRCRCRSSTPLAAHSVSLSTPPFPFAGLQSRPENPSFGVVERCPCGHVGGSSFGAALNCAWSSGAFKTRYSCTCLGMVNVDTNSDAGSLAKALFCELRVAELRALASRDATQAAELLQRQQQATAFRAKLPVAHRVPALGDGLLSLDLGETGERIKERVEAAAAKQAEGKGEEG
jgi:hypothetical protein